MRTSAAAVELDFTEPSITAAKAVACAIAQNGSLQRDTLLWVMEQAYGGSSADGRWSLRDAYDMLELAEVMHLEIAELPSAPQVVSLHSAPWSPACRPTPSAARSRSNFNSSRPLPRSPILPLWRPGSRLRIWYSNPLPAPAFSPSLHSELAPAWCSTRSIRPAPICWPRPPRAWPSRATTPS